MILSSFDQNLWWCNFLVDMNVLPSSVYSIFIPKSAFQRSYKKYGSLALCALPHTSFTEVVQKIWNRRKKELYLWSVGYIELLLGLVCVVFSNLAVSLSCNDRLEPTLPTYHVSFFPLYQCQTCVSLDCATENVPAHQNFPWNNT